MFFSNGFAGRQLSVGEAEYRASTQGEAPTLGWFSAFRHAKAGQSPLIGSILGEADADASQADFVGG